jgi:hypothetical protein
MALRLASNSSLVIDTRHLLPGRGKTVKESALAPDALFAALDGRTLTVSGRRWLVEVYSVCDSAGRRWIQLGLDGRPHYMLTLKLAAEDGVRHAILALSSWLANPAQGREILNVA